MVRLSGTLVRTGLRWIAWEQVARSGRGFGGGGGSLTPLGRYITTLGKSVAQWLDGQNGLRDSSVYALIIGLLSPRNSEIASLAPPHAHF